MNKKRTALIFLFVLILLPLFVSAAGSFDYTPLEKIPGSDTATSTTTDFYTYVYAIYKFGIWAVGIVALFMLVFGGYTYITSAGNNSSMETAKKIITDAIVGIIMALTAYLLLYVINPDLVKMKRLTPAAGVSTRITGGAVTGGARTSGTGNGNCQPVTSGPCSVTNMQNSCFGAANANAASAICYKESTNNAAVLSTTDKCQPNKTGPSFSVGLFQINLTVHDIGLRCTSAFNGTNYSCTVKNNSLYQTCVSAAKDPNTNIPQACQIFNSGGWNQWGANKGTGGCGF